MQHLRAWIGYGNADCRVYFWRTRGGLEVDFVLYGAAGFWAIEVKNGRSLRPADLRSIKAFHQDYPEATPLVLYRGAEALQRDGSILLGLHTDAWWPRGVARRGAYMPRPGQESLMAGGPGRSQASAVSKAVRLRVARLNSTPMR